MRAVTTAAERSRARFHELTNQEADMGICGCAKWTKLGCDWWCRYEYLSVSPWVLMVERQNSSWPWPPHFDEPWGVAALGSSQYVLGEPTIQTWLFRLDSRQVLSYSIHMRGGFLVPQMGSKLSVARFLTPNSGKKSSGLFWLPVRFLHRFGRIQKSWGEFERTVIKLKWNKPPNKLGISLVDFS